MGSDRSQLANTAKAAKEAIGTETLEAVADRGYFNGEEIKTCVDDGITVTLPKPMTSSAKAEGPFGKEDFVYLAAPQVSTFSHDQDPQQTLRPRFWAARQP